MREDEELRYGDFGCNPMKERANCTIIFFIVTSTPEKSQYYV
jgi:hypothetical protein